jgi:hypothetical protein
MISRIIKRFILIVLLSAFVAACSGTKLTETKVDSAFQGKTVSSILVIAVTDKDEVRRSFEDKFVAQLKSTGVEAFSSADVMAIPSDQQLEKKDILVAVDKFKNDAVMITHLVGVEEKEVYHPPARRYPGYYGYYGSAYYFSHEPGYYSEDTFVLLETNLYDVATEKLIWSGHSETWNPESTHQIIDEVIKVVISELNKHKLLKPKT